MTQRIISRSGLLLLILISIMGQRAFAGYAAFPPGRDWKQTRTEHFIIIFQEQHRDAAQYVAQFAESVHQQVTGVLEYVPPSTTYVVLTDHQDVINGYATPLPSNKIVLFLREPGAGNAFFGLRSPDWLKMVFTHEFTHIVHIDMVDNWYKGLRKIFGRVTFPNFALPLWMIEGLAVYMETKFQDGRGHHPHYDMMMRAAVLDDEFKGLDQMSVVGLREWPMNSIYYLYGYFFTQYLADTYGEESIVQLNHEHVEKFPLQFWGDMFETVYDDKDQSTLFKEWRTALRRHYQAQIEAIQRNPVTTTQAISTSGYSTSAPHFAPDGSALYYVEAGPHNVPALVRYELESGERKRLIDGDAVGSFTLSPDGQRLYFCRTAPYNIYSYYSDLYVLDLKSGKSRQLTHGARAFEPAVSPNGKWLVFTTTEAGKMTLQRMNVETGEITVLLDFPDHTQIGHPAFSADGSQIALQLWKEGGFQDIYLMNSDGSNLRPLTFDRATDSAPTWGLNDTHLFFSSDRTGVPNIFAYRCEDKALLQVTNVLTGVFHPAISPDARQLAMEYYSSNGMDIYVAALKPEAWKEVPFTFEELPESERPAQLATLEYEQSYTPFPSVLPKLWLPSWGLDDEGFMVGALTSGTDALNQHIYSLSALYGLESERMSFNAFYQNRQFYPQISLFGYDRARVFSDMFETPGEDLDDDADDDLYWQRDQVAGIEISIPLYLSNHGWLSLHTGYRYHNMKSLTDQADITPTPDEGALSGVSVGLDFGTVQSSVYGVGPESGFLTSLSYQHDDEALGSDFTLDTVVGDNHIYVNIPKLRHHVLALRTVGGMSEGDTLEQGIFQLGGYGANLELATFEKRRFALRGYDANAIVGHRFALGSAEYRFPLWYPQRGVWGGKLFFDSLALSAFFEIGDAWNEEAPDVEEFKTSAGGELRLNFGLQYNTLPLSLRLGYAEGFDEELGTSQFYVDLTVDYWL